jgi:hypothetical protein
LTIVHSPLQSGGVAVKPEELSERLLNNGKWTIGPSDSGGGDGAASMADCPWTIVHSPLQIGEEMDSGYGGP